MKIIHDAPIGLSPRQAGKAFNPQVNEHRIRDLIRSGELKCYVVFGSRSIILRTDLEDYIRKQPERGLAP